MNIKFLNKCVLIKEKSKNILVLGDLHIGYEESLNKIGVLVPRMQFKEMVEELREIFSDTGRVDEIVLLGDLKHEFGEISKQEWKEVTGILDLFKKWAKQIILIKGNHDTILGPIAKRKEIEIKEFYVTEGICFLHGHKMYPECLDKKIKSIILGHRHPAVVLSDKYKKERYKCFLVGKWKGKKVIILPSFFPFIEGSDIINVQESKLFISKKVLNEFEVYVIGKGIYKFDKLKNI